LLIFHVMTWYTCLTHSSDTLLVLKTAILYGIGCQSVVRYYVNLTKTHALMELLKKTNELYVVTKKNKKGPRQKVMNDCIDQAARVFKLAFILYLIAGSFFLVSPIYNYVISERKTLIFPFEFPFINIESPLGFGVTFTIQVIINALMVVGLSAVDGAFIVFGMQVYGIVELLKIEFEILAVELEFSAYTNVPKNFRKLIIGHQKLDAFIAEFNEFYGSTSCAVIISSVMSICVGIISIVYLGWYAALGFLIAVFYQLFITCAVGTFIQVQVRNMKKW
jgi:7tm Odorant receptor